MYSIIATLLFFLVLNCQAANQLTLVDYTAMVLNKGDDNKTIQEQNHLAELDVALAKSAFDFKYFPIVSLNESTLGSTQGVGFEVKKKTQFGSQVTLGTKYEKFESDNYSSESPKSYLRLEQGLFRQWGYDINSMPLKVAEIGQDKLALQSELLTQNLIARAAYLYLDVVLTFKQHELSEVKCKAFSIKLRSC
ncbi:hypothetical protein L3081_18640 [Colwellia sp. MSW7]|uniref:TolC family protein n=1 Tax=Colwellia maritima TaxID=2912588 RepID=A0ABS9X463_9GAMM|nr:hypothetical protein [Colwellia maritima]MCI2285040.1 hypothetical protein [Colwellia maritima]